MINKVKFWEQPKLDIMSFGNEKTELVRELMKRISKIPAYGSHCKEVYYLSKLVEYRDLIDYGNLYLGIPYPKKGTIERKLYDL